jgi:hypothetical protein
MAKKKPDQERKVSKTADRHKVARGMVPLPPKYHRMLKELAARNKRPASWELLIALDKHFETNGMPPVEPGN